MFSKLLLDDDSFRVTVGLLGGITVTVKRSMLQVDAVPEERKYLLDVLAGMERAGVSIKPKVEAVESVMSDFANAVAGRHIDGRACWAWQLFFVAKSPDDKAKMYVW